MEWHVLYLMNDSAGSQIRIGMLLLDDFAGGARHASTAKGIDFTATYNGKCQTSHHFLVGRSMLLVIEAVGHMDNLTLQ